MEELRTGFQPVSKQGPLRAACLSSSKNTFTVVVINV